jgi:hypothetical protein
VGGVDEADAGGDRSSDERNVLRRVPEPIGPKPDPRELRLSERERGHVRHGNAACLLSDTRAVLVVLDPIRLLAKPRAERRNESVVGRDV